MTTTSINFDTPPFVNVATKGLYTIRTLEPGFLSNFDLSTRVFRSMITDHSGEILSIAPAKSLPNEDFFKVFSEENKQVTEIVEGTMINLFWSGDHWEIATKRSVGCNYHFFRNQYFPGLPEPEQKTFKQMFLDGIMTSVITPQGTPQETSGITPQETVGTIEDFANSLNLSKNRCYSFVVQHPSNHIVVPVEAPATYLVNCYEIDNASKSFKYINVFDLKDQFATTAVKFPRLFHDSCEQITVDSAFAEGTSEGTSEEGSSALTENINRIMKNPLNSYKVPGVMVTELKTGFRTSFINDKYTEIKLLRGNNPNLHYQYLVLRKVQKADEFLRHFPQYGAHFARFKEHFETFATRLHRLYMDVHVTKVTTLDTIEDKRDKYHVEKLHYTCYVPAIKAYKSGDSNDAVKPKVTRKMVMEYLDSENVMVPI